MDFISLSGTQLRNHGGIWHLEPGSAFHISQVAIQFHTCVPLTCLLISYLLFCLPDFCLSVCLSFSACLSAYLLASLFDFEVVICLCVLFVILTDRDK